MDYLTVLVKPASGLCNMSCEYCFYCDEAAKRSLSSYGMMSTKTLRNVIRRTIPHAERLYTLAFQGGEPTLCGLDFFKEAVALVRQYNQKNIHVQFSLQTNGYLPDEEWCRFFADNNFLIGVSVDGLQAIHDKYRLDKQGAGTWRRVLNTTELLNKYRVDYNILTVIHKETASRIREIYYYYRERGWDFLQFIACLDPLGEKRGAKEYSLLPQDYGTFLIRLFDLWYRDFKKGNQPYIRQFENYVRMMIGFLPDACEHSGVCQMQTVIEADGSVYPCDFYVLDEYRLGNLNTALFPEICKNSIMNDFTERSRKLPEKCLTCEWRKMCRGGCYRNRLVAPEEPEGLNYFCESYQMFFSACHERIREVAGIVMSRQ